MKVYTDTLQSWRDNNREDNTWRSWETYNLHASYPIESFAPQLQHILLQLSLPSFIELYKVSSKTSANLKIQILFASARRRCGSRMNYCILSCALASDFGEIDVSNMHQIPDRNFPMACHNSAETCILVNVVRCFWASMTCAWSWIQGVATWEFKAPHSFLSTMLPLALACLVLPWLYPTELNSLCLHELSLFGLSGLIYLGTNEILPS